MSGSGFVLQIRTRDYSLHPDQHPKATKAYITLLFTVEDGDESEWDGLRDVWKGREGEGVGWGV